MQRHTNKWGAVRWDEQPRVEDEDWTTVEVTEDEVEQVLRSVRVYTFVSGDFICITAEAERPELVALGGRPNSYSRRMAMGTEQDGFNDETEWRFPEGPLTPIARKVANEQAQIRRLASQTKQAIFSLGAA